MDVALETVKPQTFTQPQINTEGVKPILRGQYVDTAVLLEKMEESDNNDLDIGFVYNNIHNILHYVDKNNPQGPYPADPRLDDQYDNWEFGVQKMEREYFWYSFTRVGRKRRRETPTTAGVQRRLV
jgi:hypothetical protein